MDALEATAKALDALNTQSYPGTEEGIGYALVAIARHLEAINDELRVMNAHNTGAFDLEEVPLSEAGPISYDIGEDDLPY